MKWNIDFISETDFENHVENTINNYKDKLKPYDLSKFNKNIIDPIKLIFDKKIYNLSWEEILKNEIFRQRDKANNNEIGYFHQNIFKYISGCEVPKAGWDVIYKSKNKTIYAEMKNKHNTMNSASSQKTYIKMQNEILQNINSYCYLVEIISTDSQKKFWKITLDGKKYENDRIFKISIDKFYEEITGDSKAFYKICMVLPEIIDRIIVNKNIQLPVDTVYSDIKQITDTKNISMIMAIYLLGFDKYIGFEN